MVMMIIDPPEAEVGAEYDGEIVSVATYGAFCKYIARKRWDYYMCQNFIHQNVVNNNRS